MLSRLEEELKKDDENLYSRYILFKEFSILILKWENPSLPPKNDVYFTEHGSDHCLQVITYLNQLTLDLHNDLTNMEKFLLLCAAWGHDLGMKFGEKDEDWKTIRDKHHKRSAEFLSILGKKGEKNNNALLNKILCINDVTEIYNKVNLPPFSIDELAVLKNICEGHCSSEVLKDTQKEKPLVADYPIRQHLLIALIRIADICDVGRNRAPESIFHLYKENIPEDSISHWERHQCIYGININHEKSAIVLNCNIENIDDAYKIYFIAKGIEKELFYLRYILGKQKMNFFGVILFNNKTGKEIDNLELLIEPPNSEKINNCVRSKLKSPYKEKIDMYLAWNSSGEDIDLITDFERKLLSTYRLPFTYYKTFKFLSYPAKTHFELLFQPLLKKILIELHLENELGDTIFEEIEKNLKNKNKINCRLRENKDRFLPGKYRGLGKEIVLSKPIYCDDELIEQISEGLAQFIEVCDPLIFDILENKIQQEINQRYGLKETSVKIVRKELK